MSSKLEIDEANRTALEQAEAKDLQAAKDVREIRKVYPYRGFVDLRPSFGTPITMFCNNDEMTALQLFWRRNFEYEPTSLKLWAALAKRASTILDIGAHIGVFSLVAATVNPKAKVRAFEAIDYIYSRLVVNVFANNLRNIEANHLAMSDARTETDINLRFGPPMLSTGSTLEDRDNLPEASFTKRIKTDTVDNVMNGARADLIKIDVEGHEIPVLEGAAKTLAEHKPFCVCEVLKSEFRDGEVFRHFADIGYRAIAIHDDTGKITLCEDPVTSHPGAQNYLFVHASRLEELDGLYER